MSTTAFGHSAAELEEKLAAYWQLVEERETLEARIARARTEKDSVSERIFLRVMAEYETALEAVNGQLTPLKTEIDDVRRAVDAEARATDAVILEVEDDVAEAEFRQRIGEFDPDTLRGVIARLEPRLAEARKKREDLDTLLAAMDRRRNHRPATEEPVELKQSSMVSDGKTPPRGNGDDENDPLSALSDPSPASERQAAAATPSSPRREPAAPAPAAAPAPRPTPQPAPAINAAPSPEPAPAATAVAPSYPSLVIRTGAHEGKIVPLLPITMSIGREHDNNVELKDQDVARYHARILYEEGRFVIEDLDSSSGTWVNGVRQRRTPLSGGDVIRIGTTELAFEVS